MIQSIRGLLLLFYILFPGFVNAETDTYNGHKAYILRSVPTMKFIGYWQYGEYHWDYSSYSGLLHSGQHIDEETFRGTERFTIELKCSPGDKEIRFIFRPPSKVRFSYEQDKMALAWSHNSYPARSVKFYKSGTLGLWLEIFKHKELYRKMINNKYEHSEVKLLKLAIDTELNGFLRIQFITDGVTEVTQRLTRKCGIKQD